MKSPGVFRRGVVAALLWMVATSAGAARLVDTEVADAKPQFLVSGPVVSESANAPGIKSQAKPVRFNAAQMLALRPLEEVQLTLPNGRTFDVLFELRTDHGGGIASWSGRVKGYGDHYRVLVTTGPGGSFGSIDTPEGTFRLVPGADTEWLVDMTAEGPHVPRSDLHNDERIVDNAAKSSVVDLSQATFVDSIPGVNFPALAKLAPVPQVQLDIMFVVTRTLANRLGTNLATRLNFLVQRANDSYIASEVAVTMRMVHFKVVDYTDGGDNGDALDDITGNVGVFAGLEALRTTFGADVVALLRDGSAFGGSGVAWRPSNPAASPTIMYSVTTGCVSGCESVFIHEVGHNMGNSHDRRTASWQGNAGAQYTNLAGGFSFGYAFCKSAAYTCNAFVAGGCGTSQPECSNSDGSNFSDLMAYFHGTTDNLYKFSNPAVMCRSTASGNDATDRPCGVTGAGGEAADTATSMNNNRVGMSAIRLAITTLPGYVQFTAASQSAAESAGTMTFTVSRVGGSTGAISVNYAVTGGTATAGVDFTSVASGTLNWASGDTSNKSIVVTLVNDGVVEPAESFTVTLSNPAGATGVYIGFPSAADGLILGDFGGTVGGALITSGDWTVANDQANDGTTSLRSAQAVASGACPPCVGTAVNSDLTYTANIPAGTITFAYRVSSYQGLGNFEFSVDGTTVLTASGETGWRIFTYSLGTGGSHTLRWRYANQLNRRCNTISPAAEGGVNCADRVWIDSVSLPASVAPGADLALAQAATPSPASAGKDVMFTLTVTNNGPSTANTVTLTNPLPAGSSYIWASPGCGLSSGTVTCTRSSLASGANAVFKIVARPAAAGSITSNASVAASESDSVAANNSASTTVTVNATPVAAQAQRYRLYSPVTLEHHFTTDLNEYNVLGTLVGTWVQEGNVGRVLNNPGSFNGVAAVPYYRLYDNNTRWHHWTTDANEYYTLSVQFPWWNGEGVDGYILPTQATGTVPLYRLLYPFVAGLHHWTIDANEYNTLITPAVGWIGEGGSGFVIP